MAFSLSDLPEVAKRVGRERRAALLSHSGTRQALCFVRETTKAESVIHHYLGLTLSQSGTLDGVRDALASVVLAAFIATDALDVDLAEAIELKVRALEYGEWR